MVLFLNQNLIQIYTKTHQIAPFKKIYWGSIPPNPLAKRMASQHQISKSQKNIIPAPPGPLPNPGDAPVDPYNLLCNITSCFVCAGF